MNKTIETGGDIPQQEQLDSVESPVSQEEMDAELQRMREAVTENTDSSVQKSQEDAARIEQVRQNLISEEPPRDGENGAKAENASEDEDGKKGTKESRHIHESNTHYEYDPCPKCGGSGRRFFIFPCFTCGGTGNILASVDTSSSTKHIEVSSSDSHKENEEEKPEEQKELSPEEEKLKLPAENPEHPQNPEGGQK